MRKQTIISDGIAVLYATREGHTARIAARVARDLRAHGGSVTLHNLRDSDVVLAGVAGVVLAASVHLGRHEREMVRFVRRNREHLAKLPTLFLSVSMSEAPVEDPARPESVRARFAEQVRLIGEHFFKQTGFRPTRFVPVAGRIAYRQYNFLVRAVMKKIAAAEGNSTDTTRDHEYTNWAALDAAVESFIRG
jgi:menaquinone-dependent protoporphyrinogen oxidase